MSEDALHKQAGGSTTEAGAARGHGQSLLQRIAPSAIWAVLLVLTLVSTLVSPVFFTTRNISTLLKQAASLGIVSVGQTLTILPEGDRSIRARTPDASRPSAGGPLRRQPGVRG